MDHFIELFQEGLHDLNITLSEQQFIQFKNYFEILVEKNKVMNLTSITDLHGVIEKHFLDSLSLVKVYDLRNELSLIDIGTGAGFPGIPLKIAFPCLRITLADSLNKRILFLDEVISSLGLYDIDTVHCRAEDLARNKNYRENFDLCVSRAVADLSVLSEYCIPFLKLDGLFVSYKSGEIEYEIARADKSIHIMGGKHIHTEQFHLGENSRSLVCIRKIKPTPKTYPRKAGTPSKSPL